MVASYFDATLLLTVMLTLLIPASFIIVTWLAYRRMSIDAFGNRRFSFYLPPVVPGILLIAAGVILLAYYWL